MYLLPIQYKKCKMMTEALSEQSSSQFYLCSQSAAAAAAAAALCVAILLLLLLQQQCCSFLLLLLCCCCCCCCSSSCAGWPHCCWYESSPSVCFFSSFQRILQKNTYTPWQYCRICGLDLPTYILGKYGHTQSQRWRQHAAANPPLYIYIYIYVSILQRMGENEA